MSEKIKKISNHDWHFKYWGDHYNDIIPEYVYFAEETEKMVKKAEEMTRLAKNVEINRREHAVRMGVGIKESDEKFNDQAFILLLNKSIKDLIELRKQFGITESFT